MWNRHSESRGCIFFEVKRLLCEREGRKRRNTPSMIFIDTAHPWCCVASLYDINHPTEPIEGDEKPPFNGKPVVSSSFSSVSKTPSSVVTSAEDTYSSLGVRQCSVCFLHTGFAIGSASHPRPTVVLMCQTAALEAVELIKQVRAVGLSIKATVAHQQGSATRCSPFIWQCGCCFRAS